jgi:hypothetical protein
MMFECLTVCAAGSRRGASFFTFCAAGLSHCACGTRSRLAFDAISLSFHKEMAKEREPKAAAFGNRFRAALQR